MADRKDNVDYLLALLKRDIRQPSSAGSYIDVEETEEEEEEEYDDYDDGYDNRTDAEDDGKAELACPFCSDDFDVLGLCCHIDSEHRLETKSGICPLCASSVRMNMAAHVISQHESLLKALAKKKLQNNRMHSGLSSLRKELQNLNLHLHVKESSRADSSSNAAGDSLMLSFVNNQQPSPKVETTQDKKPDQTSSLGRSEGSNVCERGGTEASSRMDKHQEEKLQRCKFVHDILFSTILDDFL
ncbi:hypothetical protein DM860_011863 [Cuscuta australis]|uniref:Drought induced 19 protein type zinc-binding domain-containing protein n=2 Tax=Cuscuta sect. Cleistogrammica TaxID=1824901 RepID=A0A328DA86_9ASTE|nr:hypothetical protein DM860_011863 [Cuscuta australis]